MAVIEAFATTYLALDAATVTFSSLGTYDHLQVRASLRGSSATVTTHFHMRPNGDTTGLNFFDWMEGYGSTSWSDGRFTSYPYQNLYEMPMGAHDASAYATWVIDFPDYRSTTKTTTFNYIRGMQGITGAYGTPTGSSGPSQVMMGQGVYNSALALTSFELLCSTGSFARGATFTVYGIQDS